MGRGRAKAKQTKVARRLKYSGPDTDLQALENELRGTEDQELDGQEAVDVADGGEADEVDDNEDDQYAHYADEYGDTRG